MHCNCDICVCKSTWVMHVYFPGIYYYPSHMSNIKSVISIFIIQNHYCASCHIVLFFVLNQNWVIPSSFGLQYLWHSLTSVNKKREQTQRSRASPHMFLHLKSDVFKRRWAYQTFGCFLQLWGVMLPALRGEYIFEKAHPQQKTDHVLLNYVHQPH